MKPKLSIIVVSFNTKSLTEACLKSIYANPSHFGYEILVVDNASTDGSREMLRDFTSRPNFTLIKNSANLGFAKANNQAARKSKGEYLFLLNSDTVVKKDSLDKLIRFAEAKNDLGVVGPKLLNPDGSPQASCLNFPTVGNAIRQYFFGQAGLFDKFVPRSTGPVEVDAVVGAAFLISPSAKKKVGLLDERYFFYFEDLDYCRRVRKAGLKVYYLPLVEIVHYHGASGQKIAVAKDQWRRLIPSSKIYYGMVGHYLITFVLWCGQKWQKLTKN